MIDLKELAARVVVLEKLVADLVQERDAREAQAAENEAAMERAFG